MRNPAYERERILKQITHMGIYVMLKSQRCPTIQTRPECIALHLPKPR